MGSYNIGSGRVRNNIQPHHTISDGLGVENAGGRYTVDGHLGQNAAIYSNHILRLLPASLLIKLRPHMRTVSFKGGEYVYKPEDEMDWVYFPEMTAISELQILEDGRTIEASLTGREGIVGVQSLLGPDRSLNWVQVCVPGTAVMVNSKQIRKEMHSFDWVNSIFQAAIRSYIGQLSQKVACNAHHSVEERLAAWLLMLRDRCCTNRLILTQEYVARVLGVYRPSVTCIAQDMRQRGLIDYVRGSIIILDHEGLKARSCGCFPEIAARPADLKVIGQSMENVSFI